MKNPHLTFGFLLVLTLISVGLAREGASPAILLGLGYVKLLLVVFNFMDISRAHVFWKCAIAGLPLAWLTISLTILDSANL